MSRSKHAPAAEHPSRPTGPVPDALELLNLVPAITWVDVPDETSPHGTRCVYISDQIGVTGYTASEWLADPGLFATIVHPDDREAVLAEARRCIEGEIPFVMEYRVIVPDGRTIWWRDECNPAFDRNGTLEAWHGVTLDITKQKEAEESRDDVEANAARVATRLIDILESVTDGFVAFDADFNYSYVNTRGAELLGRKPEDLLGKNYWEEFPEAADSSFSRAYRRCMDERVPIVFEDHYEPWDRWFENRIYPTPDGGIAIYFQEITERKRLELAVRESEERLTRLIETVPSGIAEIDMDANVTFANEAAQRIVGFTRDQVGGRYEALASEVTTVDGRPFPPGELPVARALRTGESVSDVELAIRKADGEVAFLSISVSPIREADGHPTGVLASFTDITSRKLAEKAEADSAERERNILESVTDGFLALDADWRYTYMNVRGAELLGRKPEELLGKNYWEEFPEAADSSFSRAYRRCMDERVPVALEDHYEPWDRWFENRIYPTPDGGIAVYFQEITERKHLELALRESEERLTGLIETVPSGIAEIDTEGNITFANEAAERILGLTRDEIGGRRYDAPAWEITSVDGGPFPPEELPAARVLSTGESVSDVEHAIREPGGEVKFLSVNASPVRDANERMIGVLASFTDITKRKLAEKARAQVESRYSSLFENTSLAIGRSSLSGKVLDINEAGARVLGFGSRAEAMSEMPDAAIAWVSLDDRARFVGALSELGSVENLETELRSKDGSRVWVSISARLAEDESTEEPVIELVAVNITERVLAERELDRARLGLEAAQALAGLGSWEFDPATMKSTWSAEMYSLHGRDPSLGEPTVEEFLETVHPDDREMILGTLNEAVRTGEPRQVDLRLGDGGSPPRVIEARIQPVTDESGETMVVVGSNLDVTERVRAAEELESYNRRLSVLAAIDRLIISATSQEALAQGAAEQLLGSLGAALVAVSRFDPETSEVVRMGVSSTTPTKFDVGGRTPIGSIHRFEDLKRGEAIVAEDVRAAGLPPVAVQLTLDEGRPSAAVIPMLSERGELIGTLFLSKTEVGPWPAETLSLARQVSDRLGIGIRQVQLREDLERFNRRLSVLTEIDRSIISSSSQAELAQAASTQLLSLLGVAGVSVQGFEPETNEMVILGVATVAPSMFAVGQRNPAATVDMEALTRGEAKINEDVRETDWPPAIVQAFLDAGMRSSANFPILAERKLVGLLGMMLSEVGPWPVELLVIAREACDRLATGFTQSLLGEELRRSNRRLSVLSAVDRSIASAPSQEELAQAVATDLHELLGFSAIVARYDAQTDEMVYVGVAGPAPSATRRGSVISLGGTLTGQALKRGEMSVIEDLRAVGSLPGTPRALLDEGVLSFVSIPLFFDGELYGAVSLFSPAVGVWTEETLSTASELAQRLTVGFRQAELREELKRSYRRLSVLSGVDRAIVSAPSSEELAEAVSSDLSELLGSGVYVTGYDPEADELVGIGLAGPVPSIAFLGSRVRLGSTMAGEPMKRGETVAVEDLRAAAPLPDTARTLVDEGFLRVASVPMLVDGEFMGAVAMFSRDVGGWATEELATAEEVSQRLAVGLRQSRLRDDLARYALELEERVEQRTADLAHTNSQLEAFSHSVAHDLRAPLRAMQGLSQALLEDYGDRLDEQGRRYAERVVDAAQRMDALIQDLLSYSRVSREDLPVSPVRWSDAIASAVAQLGSEIAESGAVVSVEEPLPDVRANAVALRQIAANLVANAIKFVEDGVTPAVRVRAEERGSAIRLWIEDEGIGIAPEHRERIFGMLERLHGVDEYPGSGVGLAIVHKAVERLGGSVGVESEVGHGSRFWVDLPSAGAPS